MNKAILGPEKLQLQYYYYNYYYFLKPIPVQILISMIHLRNIKQKFASESKNMIERDMHYMVRCSYLKNTSLEEINHQLAEVYSVNDISRKHI